MFILLDIDGVMVPASSWKRPEFLDDDFPVFSMRSVAALNKIISETQADIVLTTSHKFKFNLEQWKTIFQKREISFRNIFRLNDNTANYNRKDEILNW